MIAGFNRKSGWRWARRGSASAAAAVVTLATFDPHLANFELLTFALRATLPIVLLLLAVAGTLWAVRERLHLVVWRHRALTALLTTFVVWQTISRAETLAQRSAGIERSDLRAYREGWPAVRLQLGSWLDGRGALFSRSVWVRHFRGDMAMRSEAAFREFRPDEAGDYLQASESSLGGQRAGEEAQRGAAYLEARAVYLANHAARAADLQRRGEISPLLTYIRRVTYALEPSPANAQALAGQLAADRAAISEAEAVFSSCAAGTGMARWPARPAVLVLDHFAEVTGDWPRIGLDRRAWCEAVRLAAAARPDALADADADRSSRLHAAAGPFRTWVSLFWGRLDRMPSLVTRPDANGDSLGELVGMDQPE